MEGIELERRQRAEARIGSWLRGKWRLDRVLGAGGMATVFLATHRNGMRVAVKILHPELSLVGEARKRFVNEGYAANRIEHPGVVAVLDDDADDAGSPFLVMELLDGETLEERREQRGGTLPPREVLALADQILDVLAAAHHKGVIHRDLKPENLFLTREGRLKILDFGLARLQELTGDARLTASGAGIMGTPSFLPPEQARGRWADIDARTDLWALGATLFTLSSGRNVHEAGTLNELLVAAITRPAPPLASVLPGVPAPFAAVVDRALAFASEQRFPDARSMQEAVRRALAVTPEGAVPSPPAARGAAPSLGSSPTMVSVQSAPETTTPPRAPRRAVLVVAAVVATGLIAAATVYSTRSSPAASPAPLATASAAPATPSAEPAAPTAAAVPVSVSPAAPTATATATASAAPARSARPALHPPPKHAEPPPEPTADPLDRRH